MAALSDTVATKRMVVEFECSTQGKTFTSLRSCVKNVESFTGIAFATEDEDFTTGFIQRLGAMSEESWQVR